MLPSRVQTWFASGSEYICAAFIMGPHLISCEMNRWDHHCFVLLCITAAALYPSLSLVAHSMYALLFNVGQINSLYFNVTAGSCRTSSFLVREGFVTLLEMICHLHQHTCHLFHKDENRSETISMLEQSSQAGCLQSSYLLWEHSRKTAVSQSVSSHFLFSAL